MFDVDKGKLDGGLAHVGANLKLFQEFVLQENIPSIKSRIYRDIGAHRADGLLDRDRCCFRSGDFVPTGWIGEHRSYDPQLLGFTDRKIKNIFTIEPVNSGGV